MMLHPRQATMALVHTTGALDTSNPELHELVSLIQRCRLDLSTEKHLQDGLARVFWDQGVRFEREKRLSARDIPDFLLVSGVAVECKLRNRSPKIAIYQQLVRYAEHSDVTAIVLASNVAMTLPPMLNGKPALMASLSRGWI